MWIFFALGSLFAESLETAADKIALVKNKNIDLLAATCMRLVMVCLISLAVGVSGFLGPLKFLLSWPIILVGGLDAVASLSYTYLLKHVEATGSAMVSYFSPLLYLAIDAGLLKTHLAPLQVTGIMLLILGGILFVLDPKKFRFKKEFTPTVWWLFLFSFIFAGAEYYTFKHYVGLHQINEISFLFSFEMVCVALLLIIAVISGKALVLWRAFRRTNYFAQISVSKSLDVGASYLWLHALALATVAQVTAINPVYPLMLIIVVYLTQNIFKFKVEEKFSKGHAAFKFAGVLLLCLGGFLVR